MDLPSSLLNEEGKAELICRVKILLAENNAVFDRISRDGFEQVGLSQQMCSAVWELRHPMKLSDLASFIGCNRSTMTGLADRLESLQLIQRKQSPNDRRSVIVELTQMGLQKRQQIKAHLLGDYPVGNITDFDLVMLDTALNALSPGRFINTAKPSPKAS